MTSGSGHKEDNESEDHADPPSPVQGPALLPGGSDGDPLQDGNADDKEEENDSSDSKMGEAEDNLPDDSGNVGMGKFYKPHTPRGKAMVQDH